MTDPQPLTDRETEVMNLVTHGHTNADIGRQLFLGEDTVKTHLRRALHKLGATNRTTAAIAFLKLTPQPHCGCCAHVHHILDTRRPLRHRIPDNHPWARLYDDIRTALEESP
jgi:DNA-binding CsgD family transcriptional regulator